jgi:hypothetical protein
VVSFLAFAAVLASALVRRPWTALVSGLVMILLAMAFAKGSRIVQLIP